MERVESLGSAGGFSGAQLWRLSVSRDEMIAEPDVLDFCLRKWPTVHPSFDRLQWIHLVLSHVKTAGCPFVAAPIATKSGHTVIRQRDAFWELTPWMPGTADFHQDSSDARLKNMMRALAKFHLASAQVSLDFRSSSGLGARVQQLDQIEASLALIRQAAAPPAFPEIESLRLLVLDRAPLLAPALANQLRNFESRLFPVQPVIRDVWHDHLLFTGDEVTGLVDFGAMQMDHIALDISRLLGSTIGDDRPRWQTAIESYSELRRLNPKEIELLPLLDVTATLLGSINWLKWIYVEQRQFESWPNVLKRIQHLRQRLQQA